MYVLKENNAHKSDLSNKSVTILLIVNDEKLKQQTKYVTTKLKHLYPDAYCQLVYSSPIELLVATVLSAQCMDVTVNKVTKNFFKKYKFPEEVAKLSSQDIQEEIKSIGLYKSKAKNIKGLCQKLVNEYSSKVPDKLNSLIKLPGVGRKTANVVLGEIFNKPEGIVVDTHVKRLSKRLGLTKSENPVIIERELMAILHKKYWVKFAHWMIFHGRKVCRAVNPHCINCSFKKKCYYYNSLN